MIFEKKRMVIIYSSHHCKEAAVEFEKNLNLY